MLPTVRIAALSDFHIGATERADQFGHQEADFLDFLDRLQDDHDRIVLLGDIFQTEHGMGIGRRASMSELGRCRQRMPRLSQRLRGEPYIYIYGNHDGVALTELGARESVRLESDDFTVFFIHGHQFDPLLTTIYPVARAATWLTGRLRHLGLGAMAEAMEYKDITVKHARFGGLDGPYIQAARRLLDCHRAHAVIMGHTHMPGRYQVEEGIVANTGTCSVGHRMYITIDTARRTVDLIRE